LDHDKDGMITREDMAVFMRSKDEHYVGTILEEADDDCDGGLHYKEFSSLMIKLVK
jgi:Ca2+-binding EF-hand superfamily protein